jgi:predicted  nucleic acid-binding Zn-ribbon protein
MTKTEKELQRLSEGIVTLTERANRNESDVEDVADDVERVDGGVEKLREQISSLQTEVAVLKASQLDLIKRWDESDRRRWTVYGVMLAASLTFVANLVLLFLKR